MTQDSAPTSTTKPRCDRADALAILQRLRSAGHVAYFAGGCVRDLLLGRTPKDWDVATDAQPGVVRGLFPNSQAVGAAFGVILVRYRGSTIEVATFRADAEYVDGRHPTGVRFTNAEEDARRRDFTINGLFLDPLREGTTADQVLDYVGGREDLLKKLIRAIGDPDARFNEDHLRMLRAVRFAARFAFEIEPATAAAVKSHAGQLIRISPERIAEELRIMLTPPSRALAYRLLGELGLRHLIFRFLDLPMGAGKLNAARCVFSLIDPQREIPFSLALTAASVDNYLWHAPDNADVRRLFERPVAMKVVRALRQSLKISNEESDAVEQTLSGLEPLLGGQMPGVSTMKRFLAKPTAAESRELMRAAAACALLDRDQVRELEARLTELAATEVAPVPFISGDNLTAAGLNPGPMFKRVLDAVYDAQLEGRVSGPDDAMALALKIAGQ